MSEQARKVSSEAVPEWAQGLYYNKGIFDEDGHLLRRGGLLRV